MLIRIEWNGNAVSEEHKKESAERIHNNPEPKGGDYSLSGDTIMVRTMTGILECKVIARWIDDGM